MTSENVTPPNPTSLQGKLRAILDLMTTLYDELIAMVEADSWPDDPGECVEWSRNKDTDGYGIVKHDGKNRRVHRVTFCASEDKQLCEIRSSMVLHWCDNTSCYRPKHLHLGDAAMNMAEKVERGRFRNGNMDKTHCKNGHLFDEQNTIVTANGRRNCRKCYRVRDRARRERTTPEQRAAQNAARQIRRAALKETK